MEEFTEISLRGRMAYVLCLFERLLIYYNCKKEDWSWILEKFWKYTYIKYFDDWFYEVAEFLPENILEDKPEDFEYITENEYMILKKLYCKNPIEINQMMSLIFDLGTMESYSTLLNNSPNTLLIIQEAIDILQIKGIEPVSSEHFRQYQYSECNGWGKKFDGRKLSEFF